MKLEVIDSITYVVVSVEVWQEVWHKCDQGPQPCQLVAGGEDHTTWRCGDSLLSHEDGIYRICPNYYLIVAARAHAEKTLPCSVCEMTYDHANMGWSGTVTGGAMVCSYCAAKQLGLYQPFAEPRPRAGRFL